MSGGEQERDYLPVEMAAKLLVDLAIQPGHTGIVNVCSGKPVKIEKLVRDWIADRDAAIVPLLGRVPYSQFEPMSFWGSTSKLDSILEKP